MPANARTADLLLDGKYNRSPRAHMRKKPQGRDALDQLHDHRAQGARAIDVHKIETIEALHAALAEIAPQPIEAEPIYSRISRVIGNLRPRGDGEPLEMTLHRAGVPGVEGHVELVLDGAKKIGRACIEDTARPQHAHCLREAGLPVRNVLEQLGHEAYIH